MERGDGGGDADGGGAGCFYGGPCSYAGSGEQGCPEGSAFFCFEDLYGLAVYVGLYLSPEVVAGSASA